MRIPRGPGHDITQNKRIVPTRDLVQLDHKPLTGNSSIDGSELSGFGHGSPADMSIKTINKGEIPVTKGNLKKRRGYCWK